MMAANEATNFKKITVDAARELFPAAVAGFGIVLDGGKLKWYTDGSDLIVDDSASVAWVWFANERLWDPIGGQRRINQLRGVPEPWVCDTKS